MPEFACKHLSNQPCRLMAVTSLLQKHIGNSCIKWAIYSLTNLTLFQNHGVPNYWNVQITGLNRKIQEK